MIKTKQPTTNEEKQDMLNTKIADQMLVGKKFADNVKYALRVVRKTPYIDNMILKRGSVNLSSQSFFC